MNKVALRGACILALVVLGLTACVGPIGLPFRAAGPVSTPTPTPTATLAKQYTQEDLAAIMPQLRDSNGLQLAAISLADVAWPGPQYRAFFEGAAMEPAWCKELLGPALFPVENVTGVAGISIDSATGASTGIALTTGLGQKFLAEDVRNMYRINTCDKATMTLGETTVTLAVRDIESPTMVPGTEAFRFDSSYPDGRKNSTVMVRVMKPGVLISAFAFGGKTEKEAVARAGGLLNQAALKLR